jgi:hypothetical protein
MKRGAVPIVENNLQLNLGLSVRTEKEKVDLESFLYRSAERPFM